VVKGRGDRDVRFTFKRIYYPLSPGERAGVRVTSIHLLKTSALIPSKYLAFNIT